MQGYPINFGASPGNRRLMEHPLYVKYSNSNYGAINATDVKADLAGVLCTAETSEIVFFLSSILRVKALLA